MRMRRGVWVAAIAVAGLLLAGCTPTPPGDGHPANSASASETPSSAPVVAAALIVSLDGVSVKNSDGSTGASARFSDGAGTLSFLAGVLGSTPPAVHDDHYGFTRYDWGTIALTVEDSDGSALVRITAAEFHGISLRSSEGIQVGSTIAEVRAVASPGTEFSPSGTSDTYFGLEARPHPGTESLTFPGRVGSDYIDVELTDGTVTQLRTPSGDWQDV